MEAVSTLADGLGVDRAEAGVSPPERRERANALGREIMQLAGQLNATKQRFLELIARFDREELWRLFGASSCAHWLSWRCGIGECAAREHVRVARALRTLPRTSETFRRGEASYSKVREITRVATPENEEALLRLARHGTAADVQRFVRRYRRVELPKETVQAEAQNRLRRVRCFFDDEGMAVIEARLPLEVGDLVIKALDAAAEALYRDSTGNSRAGETPSIVSAEACTPAETHAPIDTGSESGSDPESESGSDTGSETTSNVSAEAHDHRFGIRSDSSVETHEATLKGEPQPPEPLARRRADALRVLAEAYLASGVENVDTSADRYQVVVHIDQALLASRAEVETPHEAGENGLSGRCELESGHRLAVETARRLACDGALVGVVDGEGGEPLNVGRRSRAVPPALRRALRARDNGCRFPGCGRTRFTHAHHIVHWSDGGETKLSNLITVCTFHHGLLHEGGFDVSRTDDGAIVFFDPDGRPLPITGGPGHEAGPELARDAPRHRAEPSAEPRELTDAEDPTVGSENGGT